MLNRSAQVKVKPNDSRESDFSLSLAEYFLKEFKANGVEASRNQARVKVNLVAPFNGYDHVVIDCVDGVMLLRSADGERYFGKLGRFNNLRRVDAYSCLSYNATRVINRINKLNQSIIQSAAVDERQCEAVVNVVRDERVGTTNVYTRELRVSDARDDSEVLLRVYDDRVGTVNVYTRSKTAINHQSVDVFVSAADVRALTKPIESTVTASDVRVYRRPIDVIVAKTDVRAYVSPIDTFEAVDAPEPVIPDEADHEEVKSTDAPATPQPSTSTSQAEVGEEQGDESFSRYIRSAVASFIGKVKRVVGGAA